MSTLQYQKWLRLNEVKRFAIPTVTDRLIQQAPLQVLQAVIDPTFSEHSYGFRPGRRAQGALLAAQAPKWTRNWNGAAIASRATPTMRMCIFAVCGRASG